MSGALQTFGTPIPGNYREPELRIFIVDDEESSLSALGYRLMKLNNLHKYKIHCFETGEDAVKHLTLHPDLIIMDQYLACNGDAGLCGSGLIRKIRKIDPDVPVVVISGKRKPQQILESDDDDLYYLVKNQAAHDTVKKILGMIQSPLVH